MNREQKKATVERMHGQFAKAIAAVVADFQNMDVESLTKLRRGFRASSLDYFVAKNTLMRLAIEKTDFEPLKEKLQGVNSIGLAYEDPIALAKTINDYCKTDENLQVKFGYLAKGNQFLTAAEIKTLANIPSREVLLARLAYVLKSQHGKLAMVLMAVITKFVRTLAAVQQEKGTNKTKEE